MQLLNQAQSFGHSNEPGPSTDVSATFVSRQHACKTAAANTTTESMFAVSGRPIESGEPYLILSLIPASSQRDRSGDETVRTWVSEGIMIGSSFKG